MMEKLKLIDIARYLPHGLHIENYEKWNEDAPKTETLEVTGLYDNTHLIVAGMEDYPTLETIKPILRPLSDLIVERDGLTPLKELAVLAMQFMQDADSEIDGRITKIEVVPQDADEGYACVIDGYRKGSQIAFMFLGKIGFCFCDVEYDVMPIPCIGQFHLWDFLDGMKFDYRGLIQDGLAVDINTLENAPYEWMCLKKNKKS